MAHISREELRKDSFRDTVEQGMEVLFSHQQLTTSILAVVIVAALGVLGWRLYSQRQDVKASAAYDAAMRSYQGRVLGTGQPPAAPGEVTFPDEKSKYTEAASKFTGVANQYPRTHSGMLAKYYAALSDEHIAKDDDAKRFLQQLADGSDAEFAGMAKLQLAQIFDRDNQPENAVKLYQQLVDKPTVLVPKPVAMLALAQHYTEKDPAQAAKIYGQIKSDYPDTPIAEQADQGLSLLPGKS